jgi:hypothetical protein
MASLGETDIPKSWNLDELKIAGALGTSTMEGWKRCRLIDVLY